MKYNEWLRQLSSTMNKDNTFENKLQRNKSVIYGIEYLWWKEWKVLQLQKIKIKSEKFFNIHIQK